MNEQKDCSGLTDLRKTLADAAEAIAAFIGLGNEPPIDSLMEAADKVLPDLHEWRKTIQALNDIAERDVVH